MRRSNLFTSYIITFFTIFILSSCANRVPLQPPKSLPKGSISLRYPQVKKPVNDYHSKRDNKQDDSMITKNNK